MLDGHYESKTRDELVEEIVELQSKLNEAQETLNAIQNGEIDAIVTHGPLEPHIYTLESADYLYRILVQEMGEGVTTLTYDGTIFYSNAKLASMIKVPLEKITGQRLNDFIVPEDLEIYQTIFDEGLDSESKGEISLKSVDGTIIPVNISINTLESLEGAYAVITDLSEQKHHEELEKVHEQLNESVEALRESEEKYRNLVKYAPAAIYEMDLQGNEFLSVNDVLCDILGYSREELLSMKPVDILSQESKPLFKERIKKKLVGEKIDKTIEYRIRRKDGEWIYAAVNVGAFSYTNKKFPRVAVIAHDISERKKTEDEIIRQGKVLGAINLVFQESLTCETVKEVIGKCLEVAEELTDSEFGFVGEINEKGRLDDRSVSLPAWKKCETPNAHELLEDMEIVSYWGRTIKEEKSQIVNDPESDPDRKGLPEGHPPITSFLGVPLKQGKKTIGIIALANKKGGYSEKDKENVETLSVAFVEALMRKRVEVKLKEYVKNLARSNQELEQFAYVASHDLKEPLRMVSSFSQLLERRYKDSLDDNANEFIEFIVDGAQRMGLLIDDLLAYSRVTSQAEEFESVDLENILDNVILNLSLSIEENNVNVTHDPLPTVLADPSQMVEVFQNLIANAIKFKGQKTPEIHISAQKGREEWTFAVADNGIGIKPEYQKQIFEVFRRLHTREEYPGTGMGLAICQKIIERHGGRIWVESGPGKGSTFYFTIPEHTSNQISPFLKHK